METEQRRLVAGRYLLLERLGQGAAGTVWRAEDVLLGRQVAVKEVALPPGTRPDEAAVVRERTRREARAAARLDHPSAVTVFDVVEEDGRPWLVLELVEAQSLAEAVRDGGPLSPARAAQVGLALLGALEAAHAHGIVHRDVKPGNVLLGLPRPDGSPGRVVLTDFGIATSAGDSSLTSTGLLLGSPAYIAPERARGQAPGPASDLWSLGATLYTAVEGRPAHDEGGDPLRTVTAVVTGRRQPYVLAGPLAAALDGLLETDPERRSDHAQARAALTAVAHGPVATRPSVVAAPAPLGPEPTAALHLSPADLPPEEPPASAPADAHPTVPVAPQRVPAPAPVAPAVPAPRPRRSRRPAVLVAAVALLGAAGAGVALSRPADPPPVTTAGASAPPSPSASPAPVVPAGWQAYTDPAGWSIAVPASWVRSTYRDQVQFRDEAERRTLRIASTTSPAPTALAVSERAAPALSGTLEDFRQLRLAPAQVRDLDAADLEFTYTSRQTPLRVLDRTVVSGTTAQSLWWQTQAADFADALPVFEQVVQTFTPPPAAR